MPCAFPVKCHTNKSELLMLHGPVLLLCACDSVKRSLPDGEVEGVLMSVGGVSHEPHARLQYCSMCTCSGSTPAWASTQNMPAEGCARSTPCNVPMAML